jgi:hypothetical protein
MAQVYLPGSELVHNYAMPFYTWKTGGHEEQILESYKTDFWLSLPLLNLVKWRIRCAYNYSNRIS